MNRSEEQLESVLKVEADRFQDEGIEVSVSIERKKGESFAGFQSMSSHQARFHRSNPCKVSNLQFSDSDLMLRLKSLSFRFVSKALRAKMI